MAESKNIKETKINKKAQITSISNNEQIKDVKKSENTNIPVKEKCKMKDALLSTDLPKKIEKDAKKVIEMLNNGTIKMEQFALACGRKQYLKIDMEFDQLYKKVLPQIKKNPTIENMALSAQIEGLYNMAQDYVQNTIDSYDRKEDVFKTYSLLRNAINTLKKAYELLKSWNQHNKSFNTIMPVKEKSKKQINKKKREYEP